MPMLAFLLGAALSASAHELYPIRPVRATVRVEPDRVVADLRADSIVWIEEVTGLHPMPPGDWPAETRSKVEAYVNSHFRLEAGGKALAGSLIDARYRQLPWETGEEGVFFLRLVYPALPPDASLGLSARFYAEYRAELAKEMPGRAVPFADGYRTIVSVPGRKKQTFTATPEAPSFSVAAADARRSAAAMTFESLMLGARAAFSVAAVFPALFGLGLWCVARTPGRFVLATLAAVAAASAERGAHAPPWAAWAAVIAAALAASGRLGRFAPAAAGTAAALAASAWGAAAAPALPHIGSASIAAAAGALAGGSFLFAAAVVFARAERAHLSLISESRAGELFARRASLVSSILAIIGAYGFWQSLRR